MKKGKLKIMFSSYPRQDNPCELLISGYTNDVDVDEKSLDEGVEFFHKNFQHLQSLVIHNLKNVEITTILGEAFIQSNMMTLEKVFTEE
jgi:hypothetical protein